MSFNTKWDVDQYKTEHESAEHWELRRKFMMVHKHKFPEERLVCLAQVFSNVEFLGCRYPAETMQLVAELSEGVVEAYREKQKSKLQRTFVKASDAAGAKVKGLKRGAAYAGTPSDVPPKITKCFDDSQLLTANSGSEMTEQTNISEPNIGYNNARQKTKCDTIDLTETFDPLLELEIPDIGDRIKVFSEVVEILPRLRSDKIGKPTKEAAKIGKPTKEAAKIENSVNFKPLSPGIFERLFLLELENDNCGDILNRSTKLCGIPINRMIDRGIPGEQVCNVIINSHLVATATGSNIRSANMNANKAAYEKLKQICYTLKVKGDAKRRLIEPDPELKLVTDVQPSLQPSVQRSVSGTSNENMGNSVDKPLMENIGSRLMRSMGWSGGGLGKNEQGIEEPVRLSTQIERSGLGHTPALTKAQSRKERRRERNNEHVLVRNQFRNKYRELLRNYENGDVTDDLCFSTVFTKAERKVIHSEAQRLGLKSKSYGGGKDRYLVVSKRKDFCKIFDMLQTGQTVPEQYELIKPCISLPPTKESEDLSIVKNEPKGAVPDVFTVEKQSFPIQQSDQQNDLRKSSDLSFVENVEQNKMSLKILPYHRDYVCSEVFGCLILAEDENCTTSSQIIEKSAYVSDMPIRYEFSCDGSKTVCEIIINDVVVAKASGTSKKVAKKISLTKGIERLKGNCYTLRTQLVKVRENNIKFIKTLMPPYTRREAGKERPGGTPIFCTSVLIDQNFLGMECQEDNYKKNKIRNCLQMYISQIWPYDLIISPDVSSEDRLLFQEIASSLSLKANFQRIFQKDFLIVSKNLSHIDTAVAMLLGDGQIS